MELRGQDKEIGMPNTLSYNNPPNRESSTKLLPSPTLSSTVGERRRDHQTGHGNTVLNPSPQTLDHHLLYHHQQPNPHPHQNTNKPRRDPDSNPNPDPVPAPPAASGAVITPITTGSTIKPPSQPQPQPQTTQTQTQPTVRYRECLKNHAATMGGHVVDGCGEFMPSGEEGAPEALKCAACECHRNFHRKEIEGESQYVSNCYYTHNPNRNSRRRETVPPHPHHPLPLTPPPHHLHHQYHKFPHGLSTSPTAPMMMAFGSGGGAPAESSSEDLNMYQSNVGVQTSAQAQQSKKRFRTKFSQEQKDKMMEFAEKLGWKIQKHDEQQVQQFCSDVGVKRPVFKVWMHNNKQATKKKQM